MIRRAAIVASLGLLAFVFSGSAQASGGTVTGWGHNNFGQVGTGEVSNTTSCACIPTPVTITGLSGVSQTAGGYDHSLFLSANGTVSGAGLNGVGQLGNGTTTETAIPTAVAGLANAIAIDAGGEASYALLSNGTVMAWGENESGQLGIGSTTGPEDCGGAEFCSKLPLVVPGLSNVVAISAAGGTAFALLADGTVMGWGDDEGGELGDGVGSSTGCECVDHPIAIPGVAGAIAISAGEGWAMALLADRSVIAWGQNFDGQLGTGDANNYNPDCFCLPATKSLSGVRSIAAGARHGMAVMLDGTVDTWGYNYYGQLGNGTNERSNGCYCVAVPAPAPAYAAAQTASANYFDTMVLLGDGTVRGAGYNGYGELGDGSEVERLSPVAATVSGASAVALTNSGGFAIIGPSQTLSVAFAGAGTGTVQGGGGEITCPTICTAKYPQGKVTPLSATSTGGGFAGFSGPCSGVAICEAKMEADQTVTATFGVPKGTKITKAKFAGKKVKRATFTFTAPGAITGYQCMLIRPKPKPKKHKAKASKKQKKLQFAACTGPKAYKNLKPGSYTFKVRALDILGADAKPAKRAFKIHPPKKKRKTAKK